MYNLKKEFLFKNVSALDGIGKKLASYLKNKKIEKINDLLWNFPYSYTDRSNLYKINALVLGSIATINVKVKKYNFPRIRSLPNRITCEDETGIIDLVYFNSREGYIRKILPLNEYVTISGKVQSYKNKLQIINPDYVTKIENMNFVKKVIPKYSLTEGLNEKTYSKIILNVLKNLPDIEEWHDKKIVKKFDFFSWKNSIENIHNIRDKIKLNSPYYRRLAFDEILSNLIVLSKNRVSIKKVKKKPKKIKNEISKKIISNLEFKLTESQIRVIGEIKYDLEQKSKMFRILQGDVGSGKTIVSILCAAEIIDDKYQCALMAPTEILANQHYKLIKKILEKFNLRVEFLSGKTKLKDRKVILNDLKEGKIDFLIGTHSLFQKSLKFKKLGFVVIDEQHKFGVKQRMELAKKGGNECDVLLMSATPIPRTMMMSMYGDMDVSKIDKKPKNRKNIITLSKPEKKIDDLWPFINKQLENKNQIFWVCPLIEESKILDYASVKKRFQSINKKYPGKVALLHSGVEKEQKEKILKDFLNLKINILVSTTVIEVGIDFPSANTIVIENANKFGLAQLHQLRGRVGRGSVQSFCILLFKESLNNNAKLRLKVLKSSNDGFYIAEEDMRMRGYGDIIGFQQSGIKNFKIANLNEHKDLFLFAEKHIKELEKKEISFKKYDFLLKIFDRADVINIE